MTINLSALQKQRRDTAANWTAENPTLLAGEIGIESDTGYWKVGDGSTAWTSLAYMPALGGKVGVPDGTAAAPAIYFADDTGIYSPGADQLALSTSGTEALRINADGDILVADGNRMEIDEIRARDAAGLKLFDDAGAGIFVKDGGSVGIGTSSPARTLDVAGIIQSQASGTTGGIFYGAYSGTTAGNQLGNLAFFGTGTGVTGQTSVRGRLDSESLTSAYLAFETTSSGSLAERMRIDSSGRVGIGTASPSDTNGFGNALDVNGTTGSAVYVRTNGSASDFGLIGHYGTDFYINNNANGPTRFYTNGDERARIDSSGRLLVGTSSSAVIGSSVAGKIQIADTNAAIASLGTYSGNANGSVLVLGKSRSGGPGAYAIVQSNDLLGSLRFAGDDGTDYVTQAASIEAYVDGTPGANDMPGRLVFSTTADGASSPTERMRIGSDGSVSIYSGGFARFKVSGNAFFDTQNGIGIIFGTNTILPTNQTGALTDNTKNIGSGGNRWATIFAGTGTINTSDANLKQNIHHLEQAELNVAAAIKGLIKKFRFTDAVAVKADDARIHVGVIAQEVEQAFVDENLDPRRYALFCEDTLEDGSKRLGIRYDELLAFVIAAL